MGLAEYVTYRLGRTPGEQARSFLGRPFGARSLADFWRYWNPVWGYFLLFYCYRPLRARLPRAAAAWGTFVACGLSHDLPFAVPAYLTTGRLPLFTLTAFFALVGGLVVVTERLRLRFTRLPVAVRWLLHGAVLFGCYRLALYATRR